MIENICYDDEPFRRHRNYVKWVCRRICASVLNRERIEKLIQDVLRKIYENTYIFTGSEATEHNELSPRRREWIDSFLCSSMSKELDDKNLLDLMAMRDKSPTAKIAADKAHDWFYERHKKTLMTVICKSWKNSIGEAEIEEIVQEVFLKAYLKAGEFKAKEENIGNYEKLYWQAHTWLCWIARNPINLIRDEKGIEINVGDLPENSDEKVDITEGEKLERIAKTAERLVDIMEKLEQSIYGNDEKSKTELEMEKDELISSERIAIIKKCADEVLSERERDIFFTTIEWYCDEEERRRKAMKELEDRRDVTPENRRQIFKRSCAKIKKCLAKQK